MVNVPKLFGSLTFNERVMKDRLPAKTFKTLNWCKNKKKFSTYCRAFIILRNKICEQWRR